MTLTVFINSIENKYTNFPEKTKRKAIFSPFFWTTLRISERILPGIVPHIP